MKRYQTTYSNGYSVETSSPYEANNFLNYGDGQTFALSGKPVTAIEFYAAVADAIEAKYEKKCETRKRVRMRYGSSYLGYEWKWIKK